MTGKWKGQGGLVDWKKAGFNLTEVYAELSDYNIALKTPNFQGRFGKILQLQHLW
jgi:hypothetical protein